MNKVEKNSIFGRIDRTPFCLIVRENALGCIWGGEGKNLTFLLRIPPLFHSFRGHGFDSRCRTDP